MSHNEPECLICHGPLPVEPYGAVSICSVECLNKAIKIVGKAVEILDSSEHEIPTKEGNYGPS